jgi:hypothetical protein
VNEIKQSKTTDAKYAARRRPDCPDPGIGRRKLTSEGYYQSPWLKTESNYPGGSQGRHGEVNRGEEY